MPAPAFGALHLTAVDLPPGGRNTTSTVFSFNFSLAGLSCILDPAWVPVLGGFRVLVYSFWKLNQKYLVNGKVCSNKAFAAAEILCEYSPRILLKVLSHCFEVSVLKFL